MTRRKAIPHCRLLQVSSINPGMMVSAVPAARGLSGQSPRKFYDVVRVWPSGDNGFVWIKRIIGYGKTKQSLHHVNDRLLVRITNRVPRRSKTQ